MIPRAGVFAILVTTLASPELLAEPVYQWVNAEGVTQFSDIPPNNPPSDVAELNYSAPATDSDPASDYWSVTNQLQRMQAVRLAEARAAAANRPQQVTRITHVTVPQAAPPAPRIISYGVPSRIYPRRGYPYRGHAGRQYGHGRKDHGHRGQQRRHGYNARHTSDGFSISINTGLRHRM